MTPSYPKSERLFLLLAALFLAALVLTNLIAGRFFEIDLSFLALGTFGLSSGVLVYPITFLVTDVISEIYGLKRASWLVKVGFIVSLFVVLILLLAGNLPIDANSPVSQEHFQSVFGLTPGIVFGSMVAYLLAQFVDVHIYEWLKLKTGGKYLWLRNNGSTVLSQVVDTIMVVTIALVIWPSIDGNPQTTAIDGATWWNYIFAQYLFKAFIALVDTPFIYIAVRYLKPIALPASKSRETR